MLETVWLILRGLVVFCILAFVSYEDYRSYKIPRFSYGLIACLGILDALILKHSVVWTLLNGLIFAGLSVVVYGLSKGKIMGGGDLKLLSSAAMLLGIEKNIAAFFIACVCVFLAYPVRKGVWQTQKKFAFAPYISFGIMASLLWGDALLCVYQAWPGI